MSNSQKNAQQLLTHLKQIPLRFYLISTMRVKKACKPSLTARLVVQRSITHLVVATNSHQLRHLCKIASSTRCDSHCVSHDQGFNPYVAEWSPYHGAAYAVIEATARLVAAGANWSKARFSYQEYFERMDKQAERFGQPVAAL